MAWVRTPRPAALSDALVLVAGGGLARETAASAAAQGHRIVGVLDDGRPVGEEIAPGLPVLGAVEHVGALSAARFVVCAGKGSTREALVARLARAGIGPDRYATVVDPSARVLDRCDVGPGSVLLAGTVLTADVTVGAHVVTMPHVVLTHDCRLDDFATVCAGVVLGGGVHVGRAAYLGMASSVREGLTVGDRAVVGMGAVVLRDVPGGETWAGVPARPVVPARSADDGR